MGRGPRIQFEGALYHVINRGNYRRNIFGTEGAAAAFEACLFEICEEMGWELQAYVVMRNHFHLGVLTPRANLAKGMQALESTFAARFNRYRSEQGHLFQSRYKSPLIEPGPSLLRVVNYIHLNPIRTGACTGEALAHFWPCSLRWLMDPKCPPFLQSGQWLRELGLTPTPEGWGRYLDFLRVKSLDAEEMKSERGKLSRGWAIGSADWYRSMARVHRDVLKLHRPTGNEWRSLQEVQWLEELDHLLQQTGRTLEEARIDRRGAAWKVEIAYQLRRASTAPVPWIAEALAMGSPASLGVYLSQRRKIKI